MLRNALTISSCSLQYNELAIGAEFVMRVLKSKELSVVSGAFDGVSAFCMFAAANIALGMYNVYQIQELDTRLAEVNSWLDYFYTNEIYFEAQLIGLPGYKDTLALSFNDASNLVKQQYPS